MRRRLYPHGWQTYEVRERPEPAHRWTMTRTAPAPNMRYGQAHIMPMPKGEPGVAVMMDDPQGEPADAYPAMDTVEEALSLAATLLKREQSDERKHRHERIIADMDAWMAQGS